MTKSFFYQQLGSATGRSRDDRGCRTSGQQQYRNDVLLPYAGKARKDKVEGICRLGRAHGIPSLIDGSNTVPPLEGLWGYLNAGFDLAAFSGGKGLREIDVLVRRLREILSAG